MPTLNAPLGGEVGVRDDETFSHGMRANGLQQEALAGAVAAYKKTEARPAVGDEGEVGEKGLNLKFAANRDVGQAYARDDSALEGVEDDGRYALGDAGRRRAGRGCLGGARRCDWVGMGRRSRACAGQCIRGCVSGLSHG